MASIASVKFSSEGSFSNVQIIRNYFNKYYLGNENPSIYEYGDNIDESYAEFSLYQDMTNHF
jgi:hypothetical protein